MHFLDNAVCRDSCRKSQNSRITWTMFLLWFMFNFPLSFRIVSVSGMFLLFLWLAGFRLKNCVFPRNLHNNLHKYAEKFLSGMASASLWQYTKTTLKIKQEEELELQMAQTLSSCGDQYSCFFLPHNQPKYVTKTLTKVPKIWLWKWNGVC